MDPDLPIWDTEKFGIFPAQYAIVQYENQIDRFAIDVEIIPMDIPMSRKMIVSLLRKAQVAEIRDPQPGNQD